MRSVDVSVHSRKSGNVDSQGSHFPELRQICGLWPFAFPDPRVSVTGRQVSGKNPVGDGSFPFFEFAFDVHGHRRPPPNPARAGTRATTHSRRCGPMRSRMNMDPASEQRWEIRIGNPAQRRNDAANQGQYPVSVASLRRCVKIGMKGWDPSRDLLPWISNPGLGGILIAEPPWILLSCLVSPALLPTRDADYPG